MAESENESKFAGFDFWLGEWACTWEGGNGTNRVTKILDGRVIQEEFDGRPGLSLQGRSLSIFDESVGQWRQTWVDNEGGYLDLAGDFTDGEMRLFTQRTVQGRALHLRMIFTNITADGFDWRWESSPDGTEWQTRWAIRYTRR